MERSRIDGPSDRGVAPDKDYAKTASSEWIDDLGYIQLYSGRKLYPNFKPQYSWQISRLISMDDIAQSLSHQSRFNGALRKCYTVAQHVVIMSEAEWAHIVLPQITHHDRFVALHHDDVEAFIGDMPKPMKDVVPQFKELEATLYERLVEPLLMMMVKHSSTGQLCLPTEAPYNCFTINSTVKMLDCGMIKWEQRDVFDRCTMRGSTKGWSYGSYIGQSPNAKIRVWPKWWAKLRYLARNLELIGLTKWGSYRDVHLSLLKRQISIPTVEGDELFFVDLSPCYENENYNKARYFRELFGISWLMGYLVTKLAYLTRKVGY